jgi:hypothetical protein
MLINACKGKTPIERRYDEKKVAAVGFAFRFEIGK